MSNHLRIAFSYASVLGLIGFFLLNWTFLGSDWSFDEVAFELEFRAGPHCLSKWRPSRWPLSSTEVSSLGSWQLYQRLDIGSLHISVLTWCVQDDLVLIFVIRVLFGLALRSLLHLFVLGWAAFDISLWFLFHWNHTVRIMNLIFSKSDQ